MKPPRAEIQSVVIIATGGTIAGAAASATDAVGYVAGQRPVAQLLAAVPALAGRPLQAEQLAQVDSKDMDHALWQALAQRIAAHLVRDDVAGVVVTHGTDTLEETAYFLQRVLAPSKPVVLTAAMRPATALGADGPQNLFDAVAVARMPDVRGVVAVLAGAVHGAQDLRKQHAYRVDAFDSGDAGPLAVIEEGRLRWFRQPPVQMALGVGAIAADPAAWPAVEIVTSHAGAQGRFVDALVASGVAGIVVAGTGNGSVHAVLHGALARAEVAGVVVWRSTRCAYGAVVGEPAGALPSAGALSPQKARIELMLRLLSSAPPPSH